MISDNQNKSLHMNLGQGAAPSKINDDSTRRLSKEAEIIVRVPK